MLYHEDGSVKGVATNDVGIHKDGSPKVCVCMIYIHSVITSVSEKNCHRNIVSKLSSYITGYFRQISSEEWSSMLG